jgi:hypothetical protein
MPPANGYRRGRRVTMRQAKVRHVTGKIAFADRAAQTRVEAPLLPHAGHTQAAIIVRGVEQT